MDLRKLTRVALIAMTIELVHTSITIFIIQFTVVELWYSLEIIDHLNNTSYLLFLINLALFFTYLKLRNEAVIWERSNNKNFEI